MEEKKVKQSERPNNFQSQLVSGIIWSEVHVCIIFCYWTICQRRALPLCSNKPVSVAGLELGGGAGGAEGILVYLNPAQINYNAD